MGLFLYIVLVSLTTVPCWMFRDISSNLEDHHDVMDVHGHGDFTLTNLDGRTNPIFRGPEPIYKRRIQDIESLVSHGWGPAGSGRLAKARRRGLARFACQDIGVQGGLRLSRCRAYTI